MTGEYCDAGASGILGNMRKAIGKLNLPNEVREAVAKWGNSRGIFLSRDGAEGAVIKLFEDGCDPLSVLELLANFAGLGIDLQRVQQRKRSVLKRLALLARRLKEDARSLKAVSEVIFVDPDLPMEMEECADYLENGWQIQEVKGTVLARGSGLQSALVQAVELVKMTTGRPHYRELTELLQAIAGKPVGEDDLRKKVDAFDGFYGPPDPEEIRRLADFGTAKWHIVREARRKRNPKLTERK